MKGVDVLAISLCAALCMVPSSLQLDPAVPAASSASTAFEPCSLHQQEVMSGVTIFTCQGACANGQPCDWELIEWPILNDEYGPIDWAMCICHGPGVFNPPCEGIVTNPSPVLPGGGRLGVANCFPGTCRTGCQRLAPGPFVAAACKCP